MKREVKRQTCKKSRRSERRPQLEEVELVVGTVSSGQKLRDIRNITKLILTKIIFGLHIYGQSLLTKLFCCLKLNKLEP